MNCSSQHCSFMVVLFFTVATTANADDESGRLERLWTRQFGTVLHDQGGAVTVDFRGQAFVTGPTDGSLCGQSSGQRDLYIASISNDGVLRCLAQWGPTYPSTVSAIARDRCGNIYLIGRELVSGSSLSHAVVLKFSADGKQLWKRPLGQNKGVYAIGTDRFGNVSALSEPNPKLTSFNSDGVLNWTVDVPGQTVQNMTVDSSNGRITAVSLTPTGGAFLAIVTQYDYRGNIRWKSDWMLGGSVAIRGMTHDNRGNTVMCGVSYGKSFSFIRKFNSAGELVAYHKFDLDGRQLWRVATDSYGNVYAAGSHGEPGRMFLTRYNASLKEEWTEWFGGETPGFVEGLSVDFPGLVTVSGSVSGALHGEPPIGKSDAFVARFRVR